jgi:hypothetical protein
MPAAKFSVVKRQAKGVEGKEEMPTMEVIST